MSDTIFMIIGGGVIGFCLRQAGYELRSWAFWIRAFPLIVLLAFVL